METRNHSIRISSVLYVAVLTAVFFPCILSSVFKAYVDDAIGLIVYWGTAAMLALLAVQQKHKLYLSRECMNWLIIWIAVWAISVFRNGDVERGMYGSVMKMLAIIIMVGILSASRKPVYKQMLVAMKILLIVQLVAGAYYYIFPNQFASLGASFFRLYGVGLKKFNEFVNEHYFMGLSTHYSTSGMYMALATVLLFAECEERRFASCKVKNGEYILLILFGIALILTQKRAHLLFSGAACIAMYLVGYVNGNLGKKILQILVCIFTVALIVILIFNVPALSGVVTRFIAGSSLEEGRASVLWKPAWNAFINNLSLGIGWSRFKWLYPQQQGVDIVNNNVHNIYLQLLCENGIIFGSLIIVLLLCTYVITWKKLLYYKKAGPKADEYLPMLFSFGYQTFFLLYGLTGNPLYDIETLYPYMICSSISFRYACRPRIRLQDQ